MDRLRNRDRGDRPGSKTVRGATRGFTGSDTLPACAPRAAIPDPTTPAGFNTGHLTTNDNLARVLVKAGRRLPLLSELPWRWALIRLLDTVHEQACALQNLPQPLGRLLLGHRPPVAYAC